MNALRLLCCLILSAAIGACTTAPGKRGTDEEFAAAQKSTAIKLQSEGKLAESLAYWRTLLPLGPADKQTASAIRALEQEISSAVQSNLTRARQSYVRGENRQGDTYMLKVLALNPGHKEALKALGKSYSTRAQAQQTSKSAEEYQLANKAEAASPDGSREQMQSLLDNKEYTAAIALGRTLETPKDSVTALLLRAAYLGAAEKAEAEKDSEIALSHVEAAIALTTKGNAKLETRSRALENTLAKTWYQRGVRLMKNDLSGAIAAFNKALAFDNSHQQAKRKLQQAETLQRNLHKIERKR